MSARAVEHAPGESSDPVHTPQPPLTLDLRPPLGELAADLGLVQSGDGCPYYGVHSSYRPMSVKRGGGWKSGLEELPPYFLTPADIRELYDGRLGWGWSPKPGPRGNAIAILDIDFHDQPQPNEQLRALGLVLKMLFDTAGLPTRYSCISSTTTEGKSRGLHFIWIIEELIGYELLYELAASCRELVRRFVEQWAAARGTTVKFDTSPGNANFIRFALSAHHKHARGSEIFGFGPRMKAADVIKLAPLVPAPKRSPGKSKTAESTGKQGAGTAGDNNTTKAKTRRLLTLPPLPGDGSLRQGISNLLQETRRYTFGKGKSDERIRKLGSLCFYYGLPTKELGGFSAYHCITYIIDRVVANGRWYCEALPDDAIKRAYHVFETLVQTKPDEYGAGLVHGKSLSIPVALVEALLKLPVLIRGVLWLCYVGQQIHRIGRLEVPLTKLAGYMDLAVGKIGKYYSAMAAKRIRDKHLVLIGDALRVQRYIVGVRADSYEVTWHQALMQGSTISQEEAESRLGLPGTYGLLTSLDIARGHTAERKSSPLPAPNKFEEPTTDGIPVSPEGVDSAVADTSRSIKGDQRTAKITIVPPKTPWANCMDSQPEDAEETLLEILINAKEKLCTAHS
jgi:hypothetical protein